MTLSQARMDFSRFQVNHAPIPTDKKSWYVVLMMDREQSGHTSIKITSDVVSLLQRGVGNKSPAIVIQTGYTRQAAKSFQKLISKDSEDKQIRGIHSRGVNSNVYATLLEYHGWIDTEIVFGVAEERVVMVRYSVSEDAQLREWMAMNH